MISKSAITKQRMNGIAYFPTTLASDSTNGATTNRSRPNGGVERPTARLQVIITAKWIGLMPRSFTVTISSGARIVR